MANVEGNVTVKGKGLAALGFAMWFKWILIGVLAWRAMGVLERELVRRDVRAKACEVRS